MIKQTTLWDIMKSFDAATFADATHLLAMAEVNYRDKPPDEIITKWDRTLLADYLQTIQKNCLKLELNLSAMTAAKTLRKLSQDTITYRGFGELSKELSGRLIDEMKLCMFFCIEPGKQSLLSDENPFGDKVSEAFPSAAKDIKDAGRCLALDQWTASVFHSMRALEIGLNMLARSLGIAFDQKNWQPILDQIEKEIGKIRAKNDKEERKTTLKFYSGAALQFTYFKDAVRNHAMHTRDTYDGEQAEMIFECVKAFMVHLATELKEEGA
jgi:HEPN domain-containing protein